NKIYALQNDERFPSYTILSIEELNDLLKKYSMTGKILVDKFGFNRKEIINFEKTIGKAYAGGKYINTAYGKIHYSKTGSHIVPFVSKEK
ncbi:TPA: polymorphic toxin type 50 domain-containing protein, partial [Staphylococcus aureus]